MQSNFRLKLFLLEYGTENPLNWYIFTTIIALFFHFQESELELQQVQILMRHGARTPFKFIPNYEPAFWPEEMTEDLQHTMINHTVRSLDFGSRPVSPIDNAYLQRKRLNVSIHYF